jgi:hypothetical protein
MESQTAIYLAIHTPRGSVVTQIWPTLELPLRRLRRHPSQRRREHLGNDLMAGVAGM